MGRGLDSIRDTVAVRKLASFLNQARVRAVNAGVLVEVIYDHDDRCFYQNLGSSVKASYKPPETLEVAKVEKALESAEEKRSSIYFHPLGDSSGGIIHLEDSIGRKYKISIGIIFAAPVISTSS
jgi:Tfp pilus assembly protein FimT